MPRVEPNISRKVLFDKFGFVPHSYVLWEMHNSTERFRIACCGRRFGKTRWAGHELTYKMFVPGSLNWICAPQYTLGEKEFRVVMNDFKRLGLLSGCNTHYNINQGRMDIHFRELDSMLEVRSAERPNSLVGEGIDHVCMSEAAKHSRSTWEMYVRPALADKRGSADFPSTPQGFNWFKGLYDLGQTAHQNDVDYVSWRAPSWENPVLFPGGINDPEIIEQKNKVSSMFFAQEIAAEFTSFEGQIYPEYNPDIHVKEFEYNPRFKNWWALDFGYVDPFVCLDIMIDDHHRIWVWREYVVSYKATNEHGQVLKNRENPEGFHVDAICADPRGADEIATLAPSLGAIIANGVGWILGVEEIKRALKVREDGLPGLIIHPRCTELDRQLKSLRAKPHREGVNAREGQHDYDDHTCDALRYFFNEFFVMGANQSLVDLYDRSYSGSEAQSFFTMHSQMTLTTMTG